MQQRFDVCRASGFDAIEPDNMDVFELGSDSGFEFTRDDGIEYALWLAAEAHARGLGIGQKNAASITQEISEHYDWALLESCYSDGDWCGEFDAYVAADKPVFMCEYEGESFDAACDAYQEQGFSPILKSLELDAEITFCD
jgi:GNAT superfamily N-acetyltransferase